MNETYFKELKEILRTAHEQAREYHQERRKKKVLLKLTYRQIEDLHHIWKFHAMSIYDGKTEEPK